MLVKCKEEYEEVKSGDIGKVIKVGVVSGVAVARHTHYLRYI